jgi:hypothetical protein
MSRAADAKEYLAPAGFRADEGDWAQWSDAELEQFFDREATHFVVADNAVVNRTGHCGSAGDQLCCEGGCFLYELSNGTVDRWQHLIRQSHLLGRASFCYQNSGINTGIDAGVRNADSAITDWAGDAVAYRSCAHGKDMQLFFANGSNSWSALKERVYAKILAIGFSGVYHDCFLGAGVSYTFSQWDQRSGLLHPETRAVTRLLGSVVLMTQEHEQKLMNMIKDAGGGIIANGQPATRTLRQYATGKGDGRSNIAGGPAGANLHFREDSPQATSVWTHLFTPITLNRFGGQRMDLDPKYNASCPSTRHDAPFMTAACVGRNIADNLDFGVATFLYDGLFPNKSSSSTNILHAMFPLTARQLGEGLIVGRERVVTKKSGTAQWDAQNAEWHFKVQGCVWASRNPLRWLEHETKPIQTEQLALVQVFELGLLVHNRTETLADGKGVDLEVQPGQIAVVSLAQSGPPPLEMDQPAQRHQMSKTDDAPSTPFFRKGDKHDGNVSPSALVAAGLPVVVCTNASAPEWAAARRLRHYYVAAGGEVIFMRPCS